MTTHWFFKSLFLRLFDLYTKRKIELRAMFSILFSLHYIIFYYILINFIFTIKETNNEKQNTVNRNNIYPSHSFLKLDHHIKITIGKSLKVLSFIMRHTKMFNSVNYFRVLYLALVHSNIEYEVVFWHSYLAKDQLWIEKQTSHPHCPYPKNRSSSHDYYLLFRYWSPLYYFYPKWLIGRSQSTQDY